jgi:hypothetical protein
MRERLVVFIAFIGLENVAAGLERGGGGWEEIARAQPPK